jgi:hypothetical protein
LSDLPDYVSGNRDNWTESNRDYTDAQAGRAWRAEEISWGIFGRSEREIGLLGDVDGLDVVELYASDEAETHPYYSHVTAEWARKWPAEEIWAARKTG